MSTPNPQPPTVHTPPQNPDFPEQSMIPNKPQAMPQTRPQISASLYVGNLAPDVGESSLYELFKEVGNVASIRVCRDAITKTSLGYAYVNFHNKENAQNAINVLQGSLLNQRPCRISWSKRDPSVRKSNVGNIFIKNLDPLIDQALLYDMFSSFGTILSCQLVTDNSGKSKGFGFVHFQNQSDATKAMEKLNGATFQLSNGTSSKPIYVAPFVPARERKQQHKPEETFTNVFIKNIDEKVTPEQFTERFSQFGDIVSAHLEYDSNAQKSKGFGFVNYKTHEQALECVAKTNDQEWEGKRLYAARHQSKEERREFLRKKKEERANQYQGVNLYIKNLSDSVDERTLEEAFSTFGTITSVKIMRNEKEVSKGFGFVCFSKPEEANRAVSKMSGSMLNDKPLYVALAQRKEARRQQLEAQFRNTNRIASGGMGLSPHMYPGPMYFPMSQNRGGFLYPQQMNPPAFQRRTFNSQQPPPGYPNMYSQRGGVRNPQRTGGAKGAPASSGPKNHSGPSNPPPPTSTGEKETSKDEFEARLQERLFNNYNHFVANVIKDQLLTTYKDQIGNLLQDEEAFEKRCAEIAQSLEQ